MRQLIHTRWLMILAAIALLGAAPAWAQTGPSLMLQPWTEGQSYEENDYARFINRGSIDRGPGISIQEYGTAARWRVLGDDPLRLTVGLDLTWLALHTSSPVLPDELIDHALAVGLRLGESDGWAVDVIAGVGYNGGTPYGDGNAWYAKGDIILTRQLDEKSSLQLLLDYNGNRTIFPDIPLPAIAYAHQASDTLGYTIGLPYSSVQWQPLERWTLTGRYAVPSSLEVEAAYEVIDHLELFAGARREIHAYRLTDADQKDRRVFFQQSLVEAGLRWRACAQFELEISGGYAFNQEFRRGFDLRETDRIAGLSDESFVAVQTRFAF